MTCRRVSLRAIVDCQGAVPNNRTEYTTLMSDRVDEIEPRTRGGRFRNSIASLRFFTSSYAARKVSLRTGVLCSPSRPVSPEVWLICSANISSNREECCDHKRGLTNASRSPSKDLCSLKIRKQIISCFGLHTKTNDLSSCSKPANCSFAEADRI